MPTAHGTFDVTLTPAERDQDGIGRIDIAKTWHGDLSGSGAGTMLSAGDPRSGEAGYVALETVEGTLDGREGGFAFQQCATMSAGEQRLDYVVVPGSGTGELTGIGGSLELTIVEGEHRYVLSYTLE